MPETTISMAILTDLEAALADQPNVYNTVKSLFQLPDNITPEMRISTSEFLRLIQVLRNHYQVEDIGKRIGQTFTPAQLGLLGLYLQTCDSLKDALHQYLQYAYLDNGFYANLHLYENTTEFSLQLLIPDSMYEIKKVYIEIAAHRVVKSIQYFCSPTVLPSYLSIEKDLLDTSIIDNVETKLGPDNIISFHYPLSDFKKSLPGKNNSVNTLLRVEVDKKIHLERESESIKQSVINEIIRYDNLSDVSLDSIAKNMAMSSRTLGRKLKEDNTNFKSLLINIKRQTALKKILKGDGIDHIATSLGFSDRSSFERAFKTWTSFTPSNINSALKSFPNLLDQQYITNTNSIPSIYKLDSRTLKKCHDETSAIQHIKNDPVLSIKILGLAKIASFGSVSGTSINQAIHYLFKSGITQSMCMSVIRNSSLYRSKFQGIDLEEHWIEAHVIAEFCQSIVSAKLITSELTEQEAYICGLSSHIGFLMLISSHPEISHTLFESYDISKFDSLSFSLAVENMFGISAFKLSALILAFWGFPVKLIAPLHTLGNNPATLKQPFYGLLRFADNMSFYMTKNQDSLPLSFISQFCDEYNIDPKKIIEIYDASKVKIEQLKKHDPLT